MFLLALILLAAPAKAELAPLTDAQSKGTVGVSFGFPAGGSPTALVNPSIGVTYFIANDVAARLDFGLFAPLSPSGQNAGFDIGAALRFYGWKRERAMVFLQPAVVISRDPASATEALTFAGAVGVEYFFTDRFSVGGTLGIGLRLGNLGASGLNTSVNTTLSTATSGLFASVYF